MTPNATVIYVRLNVSSDRDTVHGGSIAEQLKFAAVQ